MRCKRPGLLFTVAFLLPATLPATLPAAEHLPGTEPLAMHDDVDAVASAHTEQVIGYFRRRIEEARKLRDRRWQPDFTSAEKYRESLAPHRSNCRKILGLAPGKVLLDQAKSEPLIKGGNCRVRRITIPMSGGLSARGLVLSPNTSGPHPAVIVCPSATTWPEQFAGLSGNARSPEWLRMLLARGAVIYLPQSIERLCDHPYCKRTNNKDRRMILYRLGYCVGRTMPGLDVGDLLAAVDYLAAQSDVDPARIGLVGTGQGGMTALLAAALDRRIRAVAVADYFQPHDRCCDEPVDRRLCGQLLEFGDAELAALVAPQFLGIVHVPAPAAARQEVAAEVRRTARFYQALKADNRLVFLPNVERENVVNRSVGLVAGALALPEARGELALPDERIPDKQAQDVRNLHFEERLKYLRELIDQSEAKREKRWQIVRRPATEFNRIKADMLDDFRKLVGKVETEGTPLRPRTQLALETGKYKAYRVMLDVVEGVELYGNLLVPNGIKGHAAAVIAQHGLSGTPEMITGLGQTKDTAYHEFGRHLAEHGYVVFAPFIMHRRPTKGLNDQVRLADAVGMMRVAMAVAKTERTIEFLRMLPFVDPDRIGYYGLSYGGYSALWIAPLVDRLKVIVPSGHFNDWRSKITADYIVTSYLRHPDEDFYNWDILHRFTHVELVAMMAPRPVCIEFGQRDGITTPEWTAYAWNQLLAVRDHLGLGHRIELNHYDGVHEIHGVGTFDFLNRFLRPERPVGRDGVPLVEHILDGRKETRITGRFWIPSGAKQFCGTAVRLSPVGRPGPIEIRFGTAPGEDDLGTVALESERVPPGKKWCELRIDPGPVSSRTLVYFEIRSTGATAPADHYIVYGPRPLGGKHWATNFGLSYRVLTDSAKRPQPNETPHN